MSILARRQLRLAAAAAIAGITGITVDSPGDWAIAPSRLPNIKLRTPADRKISNARAMPTFTTTVTIELLATLQATTAVAAQDAIDALGQQIEAAFFSYQPMVQICQQFAVARTEIEITAEAEQHVAQMRMSVDAEVFESFDPTEIRPADYPALQQFNVHVDTGRPFDSTGTYVDPDFPDAIQPAPRTSGPDGRDEGHLQVIFP